jgi:hypothetical protein
LEKDKSVFIAESMNSLPLTPIQRLIEETRQSDEKVMRYHQGTQRKRRLEAVIQKSVLSGAKTEN